MPESYSQSHAKQGALALAAHLEEIQQALEKSDPPGVSQALINCSDRVAALLSTCVLDIRTTLDTLNGK